MPEIREVPMHLIDPPDVVMRTEMDDDKLRELVDSIRKIGLDNPLSLKPHGDRLRIVAGHRRFVACGLLGWERVMSKLYSDDEASDEEIKCAENLYREDISDADWSIYLWEIQEKYHYTLDHLINLTGKTEHWISTRINLRNGDLKVFQALTEGKINLGQAVELNRFPDNFRNQYLATVINSTPPIRLIVQWRKELEAMGMPVPQVEDTAAAQTTGTLMPGVVIEACEICGGNNMPWTMLFPRVHKHCMELVQKAIAAEGKE